MSKLENLYQSKPMQKLQEIGGKMQSNKALNSISNAMMGSMAIILAGSIFMIIATVLNLLGLVEVTSTLYTWLMTPYNMTMGLISVFVSFCVGYVYSKNLGMKGNLGNGIVTAAVFIMVAAPVESITTAEGVAKTVLDTSNLGSTGLFASLIIPLAVIRIIWVCQKYNITIKMPETVPQFLQDSFSNVIPLLINILVFNGGNFLVLHFFNMTLPSAIMAVLAIPLGALNSLPGIFILMFVALLLWSFGIHGTIIVYPVLMPLTIELLTTNVANMQQGLPLVINATVAFGALACCGGTGNVLPLAVLCMQSKSKQLKAVGKVGLVPALFNISEPMAFGVPIMYNPIIVIPFILNPLVFGVILYALFAVGFFKPGIVMSGSVMPVMLQEFMSSLAWQNLLIAPLCFVVAYLIYMPFVKAYDKQLVEKELLAEKEQANGETA